MREGGEEGEKEGWRAKERNKKRERGGKGGQGKTDDQSIHQWLDGQAEMQIHSKS